jgi:hypothetical protein
MELFYKNPLISERELRAHARMQVDTSPLITACRDGDIVAIKALMIGFWPFVDGFEKAIDRHPYPIRPLVGLFGKDRVRSYFAEVGIGLKSMVEEEQEHAGWWYRDTKEGLGISLKNEESLSFIAELLAGAEFPDMLEFLCHLAGTEYIAEELSDALCTSEKFTTFFPNNQWRWGNVHLIKHTGPSHLQIDEDLARAYASASGFEDNSIRERMMSLISESEELFFKASVEVWENRKRLVQMYK